MAQCKKDEKEKKKKLTKDVVPSPAAKLLQLLSAGESRLPSSFSFPPSPSLFPPPSLLTSKCQHISLLIGTISSQGPES
ncbi:hypothetical protein INR49_030288 [Caranx melampygus]|nr:hypothetical protein INR49_030288 [Caranx melampygus]